MSNTEPCRQCGGYSGEKPVGEVWIECCGRCNELQYVGRCRVCDGTGLFDPEKKNGNENLIMIREACEASKGYLCGLGPDGDEY